MKLTDNLLLWGFIIWLPWLMYALLRNEAKPKKNIIVGVTLPPESHDEEAVLAITQKYQKELLWITILSMVPVVPSVFIKSFGVSLTVWLLWTYAICFLGYIPYVRCNKALHRLKEARG